jgi:hypothetical protein
LYIHGGRDLKVGAMDNMWRVSISEILSHLNDSEFPVSWEVVTPKGKGPGPISHHTTVVFGDKMILVGGL